MKAFFLATYKRFLQSYPKEYRERFAQEMAQTFEDKLEDTQGFYNLLRLGFSTFIDFLATMLEQHIIKATHNPLVNITSWAFFLGGLYLLLFSVRGFALSFIGSSFFTTSFLFSPGLLSMVGFQLGSAFMYLIGFYNGKFTPAIKRLLWMSALTALASSLLASIILFKSFDTSFNSFGLIMDISLLLLLLSHSFVTIVSFLLWDTFRPLSKLLIWSGTGFTVSTFIFLMVHLTSKLDSPIGFIINSGITISGMSWLLVGWYVHKSYRTPKSHV